MRKASLGWHKPTRSFDVSSRTRKAGEGSAPTAVRGMGLLFRFCLFRYQGFSSFADEVSSSRILIGQDNNRVWRIEDHVEVCVHTRESAAVAHNRARVEILDLHPVSVDAASGRLAVRRYHLFEGGFADQLAAAQGLGEAY